MATITIPTIAAMSVAFCSTGEAPPSGVVILEVSLNSLVWGAELVNEARIVVVVAAKFIGALTRATNTCRS